MNVRHAFRNARALGFLAALGGLAQGMETPGPAADGPGSAAPAHSGLDDAARRTRLEALLKQTAERTAALAVDLSMAEVQLAKAEDLPAIAEAEALVAQRRKELEAATRVLEDLDGRLNRRGEAEAARAEGKGDGKAPGAGEERKAGATPLKPARHPFFHPSSRQAPGDVLRVNLRPTAGEEERRHPGKVVRCANGNLYQLDRDAGRIVLLQAGRAPIRVRLLDVKGKPFAGELIDLMAAENDLWCLGGRLDSGFWLQRVAGEAATVGYHLGTTFTKRPIGFLPTPVTGRIGPSILAPDQGVTTALDNRGVRSVGSPVSGEPALGPSTRLYANGDQSLFYYHDPDNGHVGHLDFVPATQGWRLNPIVRPGDFVAGGIAVTSGPGCAAKDETIHVTFTDKDVIGCYKPFAGTMECRQLARGTAPGAVVPGPGGHLVLTTANGFGCVAPDGKVTRVPVKGGRVAPTALVPGLDSGKLYFTEAGRPFLSALVLGAPGAGGAGPILPAGASLLAVDHPEAKALTRAQKKKKKSAQKKRERKQAPEAAAVGAGAGAAAVESTVPMEDEPDLPGQDQAEEAAPGADAVVSLEEEEPEAARARATVLFRQVTEAFDHICEGHLHSDAVDPAAGPAKSQFSADLGASRRRLSTLLVRGANHPDALVYFQYEEDKEAKTGATEVTVIEFTAAGTVGRVRNPATHAWSATSRVRVVQKTNPGTGEVFVASAYPIP